jgi:hypothetical protein
VHAPVCVDVGEARASKAAAKSDRCGDEQLDDSQLWRMNPEFFAPCTWTAGTSQTPGFGHPWIR